MAALPPAATAPGPSFVVLVFREGVRLAGAVAQSLRFGQDHGLDLEGSAVVDGPDAPTGYAMAALRDRPPGRVLRCARRRSPGMPRAT